MSEGIFDDMTVRQATGMIGKLLRNTHGDARFKLNRKQDIAQFCEDTAMNEDENMGNRLQCVGHVLQMEKMNIEYEKMQLTVEMQLAKNDNNDEEKEGPSVILILPPNGSEVSA